jgi:hypothetical protein
VIASRRRKVVGSMADLVEMASELGVTLASPSDVEAAVKDAAIRSLVDECDHTHEAALTLLLRTGRRLSRSQNLFQCTNAYGTR